MLRNRLEHAVGIVAGDVDDLVAADPPTPRLRWPYELVNLDYMGGLVNARASGSSRRLEALRTLFEREVGTAFLLLLTVNLRDKDRGELDELVRQQELELEQLDLEGVDECFERHRELGHAGLLKLYVPLFLDMVATFDPGEALDRDLLPRLRRMSCEQQRVSGVRAASPLQSSGPRSDGAGPPVARGAA